MRKLIVLSFVFGVSQLISLGQNLVPNPSFEDTSSCPVGPNELSKAIGWESYNGSPDYMNSCSGFSMGVPNNWGGYQPSATGNGYAAFASYSNSSPNAREFLGCELISPLEIGNKYFVSFKVSLSLGGFVGANVATNKLGVKTLVNQSTGLSLIDNTANVYNESIITDSLNWTRFFGSFICDSAANYLVIGNFFDDNNTDTLRMSNGTIYSSYYYIDDVCLSTDSLYTSNYEYVGLNEIKSFKNVIYSNPISDFIQINNPSSDFLMVKIHESSGKLIFFKKINNGESMNIETINFPPGILILNIESAKTQFHYKLLKH